MTVSKEEIEYSRLQSLVWVMEKAVEDSGGKAGIYQKAFLENARARMEIIRGDEMVSKEQEKEQERKTLDATINQMVEREEKLSAEEKHEFSGLLKCEYFSKTNFAELDHFYSNSWDKLSDDGKAEMSHRVWEGIRRGEYQFHELGQPVQRREADQLYSEIKGKAKAAPGLASVPETDRADFVEAYESKSRGKVAEVLERPEFVQHIYAETESSQREDSVSKTTSERKSAVASGNEKLAAAAKSFDSSGVTFGDAEQAVKPEIATQGTGQPILGR